MRITAIAAAVPIYIKASKNEHFWPFKRAPLSGNLSMRLKCNQRDAGTCQTAVLPFAVDGATANGHESTRKKGEPTWTRLGAGSFFIPYKAEAKRAKASVFTLPNEQFFRLALTHMDRGQAMKRLLNRAIPLIAGLIAATATAPATAASGCGLDMNPAKLDSNHNAELSRDETADTALADVFSRVDYNGDGVISQPEFADRCASLKASKNNGWGSGWGDTVAGGKAKRQTDRQKNRVNNRVDRETDKAADSAMDKAMGAIFGD